jgi:hypothetical protein
LDILVTMFSTWKQEKKVLNFSNLPLAFENKKKKKVFLIIIYSLLLPFQSNLCHIIWTWKNAPKNPQQLHHFKRLGMIIVMKTIFLNRKYNIRLFITSILRCLKKKPNTYKKNHLFSNTWTLFFNLPQNFKSISSTWK